jgi:hypothetical protein
MPKSCATFSAVSGIESMPYCAFISGLTKRQPMVVSSIFALRENALSALPITKGARHALHAAGDHQLRLARLDGARRHAHRVQRRAAQAVDGAARHLHRQPASSAAMRATLRLSSPAWLAQP